MKSSDITVLNDSGSDIPPYSIVVVTQMEYIAATANSDEEIITHVNKYDGNRFGNWLITGDTTIQNGSSGPASANGLVWASVDTGLTAPKVGEQWGPQPNQWYLTRGMPGFVVQGAPQDSTTPTLFLRYFSDLEVEGQLTASLSAPASNNTASTTSTMKIYCADPTSGATPVGVVATALSDITVVNRDKSMTGSSGYFCRAKLANNGPKIEWKITALGCSS